MYHLPAPLHNPKNNCIRKVEMQSKLTKTIGQFRLVFLGSFETRMIQRHGIEMVKSYYSIVSYFSSLLLYHCFYTPSFYLHQLLCLRELKSIWTGNDLFTHVPILLIYFISSNNVSNDGLLSSLTLFQTRVLQALSPMIDILVLQLFIVKLVIQLVS